MKKRSFIVLFALVLGVILAGCEKKKERGPIDPVGYSYYTWVNQSSHPITFSLEGNFEDPEQPGYSKNGFEVVLGVGEKHEEMRTGFAEVYPPYPGWCDSATVLFHDGVSVEFGWQEYHNEETGYLYFRSLPENYTTRYNPIVEENYDMEEVEKPNGCSLCPGARWTYTFTDDDYEAAVAYGQRTPEE